MTANDIFLAVNLDDAADRLMLADYLEEQGRDEEAELLRDAEQPVLIDRNRVVIDWYPAVKEAWEKAEGEWTGCDWGVEVGGRYFYGTTIEAEGRADLCRELAQEYERVLESEGDGAAAEWTADRVAENGWLEDCEDAGDFADLAARWDEAAADLREVERDARLAEDLASQAVDAALAGHWENAAQLANRAKGLEMTYGDCPVWGPLAKLLSQANEEIQGR